MKKEWMLALYLLGVCVLPAQAQWHRRAIGLLKPLERVPVSNTATAGQAFFNQVERAVAGRQIQQAALLKKQKAVLPVTLRNSVFTLREGNWLHRWSEGDIIGTAFVFEETYRGKRYLWGATAKHYDFYKPVLQGPDGVTLPVSFDAQGNEGMTDITLFPLPADMEQIAPLKLADRTVQLNERLYSAGFFEQGFHFEPGRKVTEVTSQRIVTSLHIPRGINRTGACGSPVLNAQNEVVGIHVGSSSHRNIGFVVPVAHLRQLLQAYHEGEAAQPLVLNGKELGSIQVNESIDTIYLANEQKIFYAYHPYHREAYLDYAHLERGIELEEAIKQGADQLILIIQRTPFSSKEKDADLRLFKLVYYFKTGQITKEPYEPYAENL